jgi:hypothetical protein
VTEPRSGILIAEGGMGKSTFLKTLADKLADKATFVRLAHYAKNPQGLSEKIQPAFRSAAPHTVILDGLDEALDLANKLCCLGETPLPDGVCVWIASRGCRPLAAVCEALERILRYRLLPFTETDVEKRAQEEGFDAADVSGFIQKHNLGDICSTPVGCDFVLGAFKQNNDGHSWTMPEIWQQGIRSLCDETSSKTKPLDSSASRFSLDQIYACAAWVALNLNLSGKTAVFIGVSETACPAHAVSVSDLIHGENTRELIEITLPRGVFEDWGSMCYGFKNATFCDYLAAEGFRAHIPEQNFKGLLLDQEKQCLLPQRMAITQWLMADHPALADAVFPIEPESFLTPALVSTKQDSLCRDLLGRAAVLYGCFSDKAPPRSFHLLKSEATRQALTDFFSFPSGGMTEDRVSVAASMATDCGYFDLLADYVLDAERPPGLRLPAVYGVCKAPVDVKRRVRPLLDQLTELDDNHDRWRAVLLRICWPDVLSPSEVFQYLTPVHNSGIISYVIFLSYDFINPWLSKFEPSIVPVALAWATRQFDCLNSHSPLNVLAEIGQGIYTVCWRYAARTSDFSCVSLVADGFLAATEKYASPFNSSPQSPGGVALPDLARISPDDFVRHADLRFAVLRAIIDEKPFALKTDFNLSPGEYSLVQTKDDLSRLAKILIDDPYGANADRWGRVIQMFEGKFLDQGLDGDLDSLHSARSDLFSATAYERRKERDALQRKREEMRRKIEEPREKNKADRLENQRNVDCWIKAWLADERLSVEKFPIICEYVYLKDGDFENWSCLDIRLSQGWAKLTADEQTRLVASSERFLKEGPVPEFKPRSVSLVWHKALVLLRTCNRMAYDALPETVWRKCAVELLNFKNDNDEHNQRLLDDLSERFPAVAQEAIVRILSLDDTSFALNHWGVHLTREQAEAVWVSRFTPETGEIGPCRCFHEFPSIHAPHEQPACDRILSELARYQPDVMKRRTSECLRNGFAIHLGNPFYDVVRRYALQLNADNCFPAFLQTVAENPGWGRKFFEAFAGTFAQSGVNFRNMVCSRSAEEIGRFLEWLDSQYPSENRPPLKLGEVTDLTQNDQIFHLKDVLFSELVRSGKMGAARVVERLISKSKGWSGHIATARRNEASAHSPMLTVEQIRELADSGKVCIASIHDLQRYILALLTGYQTLLHGNSPAIGRLWNTNEPISPKKEEDFSDDLVLFLKEKRNGAIFANREVQISRKLANDSDAGARTDIWIDCETVRQEKVSLCIEVKCSWNQDAKNAIANQLADRYMSDGRADAGILLLAWYHCDAWKSGKKPCVWPSIPEARDVLTQQALEKSCELKKPVDVFVLDCTL